MGQDGDTAYLEDLAHERLVWKMQRWAWGIFGLILLAGLCGLIGPGPLSHAEAGQANSVLRTEYDRFGRHRGEAVLKVHLGNSGHGSLPAIWIAREYLERVKVEQITPTPERMQAADDRLIYIFNLAQTNASTMIVFHVKPSGFGKTSVRMGLVDGPELQFSQFIYP